MIRPDNVHVIGLSAVAFIVMLSLRCADDAVPNVPADSGMTAVIYGPDGATPAAGALVKIFDAGDTSRKPVSVYITDDEGRYSVADLPEGLYTILAAKDSLVLFHDSLMVTSPPAAPHDDTLQCPSSLTGIIGLQPQHDPRTVTVHVTGTGMNMKIDDHEGRFTLTGLAEGTYLLLFTAGLQDYLPAAQTVTIAPCSSVKLSDTVRPVFMGLPVVSGIRISQDTLEGTVLLHWEKTAHKNFMDYVLYKDGCPDAGISKEPFAVARDTFFIDSMFHLPAATPSDTAVQCFAYRIAVRDNMQQIGPTWRYAALTLAPKAFVTTFFTHRIFHAMSGSETGSADDTVRLVITAQNRTRPLRRLVWYHPVHQDTISIKTAAAANEKEITDSIRHLFSPIGTDTLIAIAVDDAGTKWFDTITLNSINDRPKADAGKDTAVFTGAKVQLHGSAVQRSGFITGWEWKIGSDGTWDRTSGPDIVVETPLLEEAVTCSLAVTDDYGNRNTDEMRIFTFFKVDAVAAGDQHSFFLKAGGTLWACGFNAYGQLGDSSNFMQSLPVRVMSDVKSMAAGTSHSLILKTDGTLWTCGDNSSGQLGDSTRRDMNSSPYSYFGAWYVPSQVMTDVRAMAAGSRHSLFLKNDGTLWACGDNSSGQLGDGTTTYFQTAPVRVMTGVQRIAAGRAHSLILKTDGTLWACGDNEAGQLGNGTTDNQSTPVQTLTDVQGIAAGDSYSLILKTDGTLWACGDNTYGQLGDGTQEYRTIPVQVTTDVHGLAAGAAHSLILKNDGSLWACGDNSFGQLGDDADNPQLTPASMMNDVQIMAAGQFHNLILKTDGTLWACGQNGYGQLCDGKTAGWSKLARVQPSVSAWRK